jgi:hypothetical protein
LALLLLIGTVLSLFNAWRRLAPLANDTALGSACVWLDFIFICWTTPWECFLQERTLTAGKQMLRS